MKKTLLLFSFLLPLFVMNATAQHTKEDSLNKFSAFMNGTTVGGYGNAFYQRDMGLQYSTINLQRVVLFVGHKFSKKISFFSELEVEDAKVSGGEEGGEIAFEQAYLKLNFNQNNYMTAGLFLPRIGILNENHLPNTFFGNERTQVETFIIPSTWRELGVGFYGGLNSFPLQYSVAVVNGLNSASFEHGNLIRDGRFEGREASANNLAVTGALLLSKNNFKAQLSGYYGGSVGLAPLQADSLQLTSGIFGTPVSLGEASIQYESKGFSLRALGTVVSIADAHNINRAYASNTPEMAYGAYGEIGYDLLKSGRMKHTQQLFLFGRFEILDMNATIPDNGIIDGTLKQQHIVVGLNFLPINNVVFKADVRMMTTGEQNPSLVINPNPNAPAYETSNTFINLGVGFSF